MTGARESRRELTTTNLRCGGEPEGDLRAEVSSALSICGEDARSIPRGAAVKSACDLKAKRDKKKKQFDTKVLACLCAEYTSYKQFLPVLSCAPHSSSSLHPLWFWSSRDTHVTVMRKSLWCRVSFLLAAASTTRTLYDKFGKSQSSCVTVTESVSHVHFVTENNLFFNPIRCNFCYLAT